MTKIVTVVGARPQFIKTAVVSRAFREHCPDVHEVLIHTGQHYDANMSAVFFDELDIPQPDYNLGIGGGTYGQNTGRMIEAIERLLLNERSDRVLVYCDTNSTLAGALAAVKLHIPVAHIEAGLRSFNRRMPEEINRVLTDHAANLLFAPTETAVAHLQYEGIPAERIHLVGDVMYDVALFYARKAKTTSTILNKLHLEPKHYILATVHRAENTDDKSRLTAIFQGLMEASHCWPVIATDSGGVQKEAFFYRVPCVTLRNETEWMELIELDWNRLAVPLSSSNVTKSIQTAIDRKGQTAYPYGKGMAAKHITTILTGRWPTEQGTLNA